MKQQTEHHPIRRRSYSAPAMDIIALEPALQLLSISDFNNAVIVFDLYDEEENVYETEVW